MKRVTTSAEAGKAGNGTAEALPRVDRLRQLLGTDVLLLAWPRGNKGTKKKWGHLTVAAMDDANYLRELETGNIGVAQGAVSNGLCSIDCDTDDFLKAFLEANPAFSGSLRTRGSRGGDVWVRCVGPYPKLFKIKSAEGEVGEWRATGAQTIISGQHPSGCQYSFIVEAPPVAIAFESIVWPEGCRPPKVAAAELPIEHSNAANSGNAVTQGTQATQVVQSCVTVFNVDKFIPTARHQTDRRLFAMARHMKTWEKYEGRESTAVEKTAVFKSWWRLAEAHADPAMDFHAYHEKWLRGCKAALYGDDETPLAAAWRAAQVQPLPPEATAACDVPMSPKLQQFIALCYQLQLLQGTEPFHLGSRDAALLLGIVHTTVFYWFESLSNESNPARILKKVSIGSQVARRTNEYLYLPLICGG